jgi:hypothetical protein
VREEFDTAKVAHAHALLGVVNDMAKEELEARKNAA